MHAPKARKYNPSKARFNPALQRFQAMMPSDKIEESIGEHYRIVCLKDYAITHGELVDHLKYYGNLLPNPLAERVDLSAYATKLLEKADIFFALEGMNVVAVMALYANDAITANAHLPFLAVRPSHQGRGIGKRLLCHAHGIAQARGMNRINLNVQATNANARLLYESMGYRCVAREGSSMRMELIFHS